MLFRSGLSRQLGIGRADAQSYMDLYFKRYPGVQTFMHDIREKAKAQGYVAVSYTHLNQAILAQINSDVPMVNQLGFYIVQGGGKRIRPLIAVLAARALG